MNKIITAERVSRSIADNAIYQRSKLAYIEASKIVYGDILEIGTGCGYGLEFLSSTANSLITIDKSNPITEKKYRNVIIKSMNVPPILFPDCSFDCVVSFQVIEHIQSDLDLIGEIKRVLRPGGIFIVTTPNSNMSLTRNPWHIREYTIDTLSELLYSQFNVITPFGIVGNEKVMQYYNKNKKNIDYLFRLDPLHLIERMPLYVWRKMYDIANFFNRRYLLKKNKELTSSITECDYKLVSDPPEDCFDLFFIATNK